MAELNLCIVKPNKSAYSETFIQNHIEKLSANTEVLYGGAFPLYRPDHKLLIQSKLSLLSYLFQKRILKRLDIDICNKALASYLIQRKTDVVLAEYGYVGAMIAKACKLAEVPLVIHFHGADAHHQATVAKYRGLYKDAFTYASAIVVVSKDMEASIRSLGAPSNKLVLNPYGVDTTIFAPVDVASSAVNFLSVGRFVEKKSPLSTIKAFKKLLVEFPDAKLWMVGNGPLLEQAKELVKNLEIEDSITFTGVLPQSEILLLMKRMRAYVQHSVIAEDGDMEGTPNTILEASAAGLPIVSTRHAGIKEAVLDGETGYLVNEHNVDGMAEAMIKLAESASQAQRLGSQARKHIIENYQLDTQIAKLQTIIEQVVRSSK